MENYCYECGDDIPKDRHFCSATCASKYKKRFPGLNFYNQLGRQTRFRKKKNLPHYIKDTEVQNGK